MICAKCKMEVLNYKDVMFKDKDAQIEALSLSVKSLGDKLSNYEKDSFIVQYTGMSFGRTEQMALRVADYLRRMPNLKEVKIIVTSGEEHNQLAEAKMLLVRWQGIWCKNQGRFDDVNNDTDKFLEAK